VSTLRQAVAEYLTLRRGLGFKLHRPGAWLEQFVSFLEKRGASYITTQLGIRCTKAVWRPSACEGSVGG
jgi:hypothetical protein